MQLNRRRIADVLAVLALLAACGGGAFGGPTRERYDRSKAQAGLRALEQPGLVIGEFRLARDGVIDGDTLRVEGLDTSLRLLCLDTEEKFRTRKDRQLYADGWEAYKAAKQAGSNKPVKYASPMGDEATRFAKRFFEDVKIVRLERDHPKDLRDAYDRYLTYVFALKDGAWVNYNVEAVRAGMSPYFTKYGYSRRFHDEFVQAQAEARAAKRGIWDPDREHYPDYDARLAWWEARAAFIKEWEREAEGKDNYISLGHWDSIAQLERHVGKPVVLLGTVGTVRYGDRGPTKVMLSRRRFNDFPLIFFDKDVFGTSQIEKYRGEFVRVEGTVTRYYNKWRKKHELQIVIDLPGQVTGPRLPWLDGAEAADAR